MSGNHNYRKLTKLIMRTTALSNSVELSHAVYGPPNRQVMVESSDKT